MADLPRIPGIPAVSTVKDPTVASILRPMKEAIEILSGAMSGNAMASGGTITSGGNSALGFLENSFDGYDGTTDFTPPPTPTGFSLDGAFSNIILEWDDPTAAYRNHAYTEVWRSSVDALGAATLIGFAPGSVFADPVGSSQSYYYWIRFVSQANVTGAYNSLAGTLGQTALDPAYLLEVLTGAITESQLYGTLGERINQIEVNETAITTETVIRQQSDSALASQITTVSAAVGANTAAVQAETTARVNADNSLFAQYTVKVDLNGYVSGFGLASTVNNATPFSEFAIRADRFYIASPSGPGITPIIPFVVNTTPQTINGVTVPVGVYMDAAFIKNGTITNAKIGNAAIDSLKVADAAIVNAKIGDAAITTAKIADAQITNAKIANLAVGNANIQNAAITNAKISDLSAEKINAGTISADRIAANSINADKIDSRNLTIKDAAGNVIFGAGNNLDWGRISNQPSGIYNGNISIGANGVLYGAGGGAVSLGGLGAGNFAFLNQITAGNIGTYISTAAIGGAYIQNAAISNALIADAAISNAKIQNGSITSAKIGDAQITTAKIGTAQIDTLRIAGNAVTTMGAIAGTTNQTFYLNAPYGGLLAVTIFAAGFSPTATGVQVYVDGGLYANVFGQLYVESVTSAGESGTDIINYAYTSETQVFLVGLGAGNHSIAVLTPGRQYTCVGLLTQR